MNKNIFTKVLLTSVLFLFVYEQGYAQQPPSYPRVTGYFSILNPIGTWT
jgi:hypothetical protein